MKYYQELIFKPSLEMNLYHLWEKMFYRLHLALIDIQSPEGIVPVGISFPEYDLLLNQLGGKLRVFSQEQESLRKINLSGCLGELSDYIELTSIKPVPNKIRRYAMYKRQQAKSSKERIARRKAKRENISYEQALLALKDFKEKKIDTPFIQMISSSSNKRFRLFISKVAYPSLIQEGFNCYGLSHQSTVPEF